jgi:hypothetical protein
MVPLRQQAVLLNRKPLELALELELELARELALALALALELARKLSLELVREGAPFGIDASALPRLTFFQMRPGCGGFGAGASLTSQCQCSL